MIYLNRPLNCQSACFPCCLQHIEVQSPPGTVIGTVDQDWTLCSPSFTIRDQSGEVALTMEGPCLTYSICGDVEFKVRAASWNLQGDTSVCSVGLVDIKT